MHEPYHHWQYKLIRRVYNDLHSYEGLKHYHNMARSLLYLDRRPGRSPLAYVMVLTLARLHSYITYSHFRSEKM
jgi:hypothetical protein